VSQCERQEKGVDSKMEKAKELIEAKKKL